MYLYVAYCKHALHWLCYISTPSFLCFLIGLLEPPIQVYLQFHFGLICLDFVLCLCFFYFAFSKVSSKPFYKRMYNHIGYIFSTFLRGVFSNESSNCLPERMHSHSRCICLPFLHCAFWNVSSKCFYKMMHNHIGCTCLSFLHCAFSNVLLKRFYKMMHNHIGCICLSFLHCAFSNVISNGPLERMHSHTALVALVWLFSAVCFQMSLQMACPRGCKATLAAIGWLVFCFSHISLHIVITTFRILISFVILKSESDICTFLFVENNHISIGPR